MLYLLLCDNKPSWEMLKLAEDVKALIAVQQRREENPATKGYRYVNATTYGYEFVHYMLTKKIDKLDQHATAARDTYLNFVAQGSVARQVLYSPQITKLLQEMPSDELRKKVVRNVVRGDERFTEPLPAKAARREPRDW